MLKKIMLWIAVIFLSCQIYVFSADTGTESGGKSEKLTEILVSMVETVVPASAQNEMNRETVFEICHVFVRKTAHFSIYAVLAALTLLLARSYNLKIRTAVLISASYSLLYAISDEIHQLFVNGRSGQVSDVFIDFCGAICGIGILLLVRYLWMKRKTVRLKVRRRKTR